ILREIPLCRYVSFPPLGGVPQGRGGLFYSRNFLFRVVCPLKVDSTPGKSATECGKYQNISFFKLFFIFPDAQWNSSICCISKIFDIDHYLFRSKAHSSSRRIYNSQICLMRNKNGPC